MRLVAVDSSMSDQPYFNPFNGLPITRDGDAIFVPLPPDQWGGGTRCDCNHCKGRNGYWDTLAVAIETGKRGVDSTYTVHHPILQRSGVYAAKWAAEEKEAK